tara:strand:+ start:2233 stop:2697 length:465 start_codon:yes stop_codon:yes gene_type:complete
MKIATQGGDGKVAFASESAVVTLTPAVTKGQLLKLTLSSGGYSAAVIAGGTASANDDKAGTVFAIALDDYAAGTKGRVGLRGVFNAVCNANVDVGDLLTASDDGSGGLFIEISATPNTTEYRRVLGVAVTDGAGGTCDVQFDGVGLNFVSSAAQ